MSKDIVGGLVIERVPITALKLDHRNPRDHSDRQIKQIGRSIETFGFNVPVLIDSDNHVIAGHGRVLAALSLGWTHVSVIHLAHLSPAQARAFAIADNRLTDLSTWDDKLLAEILGELATLDLDFSLEATGFTVGEIDLRIDNATTALGPDPADVIPEISDQTPISASGDLWLLGKHRILCGDALEGTSYRALLQGMRAHLVFTDPPYNVRIHGHASGNGRIRHREFAMASGEMTAGQFAGFLRTALHWLARHSMPGSIHYVCMDWRHLPEILSAGREVYTQVLNVCVWVKDIPGMGSLYRSQHELILVFKSGTAPHRNNVELGRHGRSRSNVWTYPSVSAFGRATEEGKLLAVHPTVKPVALVADAILDCSARGDIVLDPFLGSGSTLIAAERVGRLCYGMEIDPLYVDTAIRRWQRHCGNSAIHAATGKSFDALADEREARHGR